MALPVAAAFDAFPESHGPTLLMLREMILDVAAQDPRIGPLTETLKWGEPAYLPTRRGIGSTVRLGISRNSPDRCAVFFICSTRLVDSFRERHPELDCEGNRAVLVHRDAPLPAALPVCVHRALTYHLGHPGAC